MPRIRPNVLSFGRWFVAVLVLSCSHAVAQTPYRDPGVSTRSMALADSVYAMGMGTAGLYLNPAAMTQVVQYAIDTGYGFQNPSKTHDFHVSLVDSQTNPHFAGGVGYTYFQSTRDGSHMRAHDVRAGLAGSAGTEGFRFAVGAVFRYLHITGDTFWSQEADAGKTLSQQPDVDVPARPVSMATFDAGILLAVQESFFIGVAGRNLVTRSRAHAPRILGVGIGYLYESFDASASAEIDFDTSGTVDVNPSLGIEYVAANMVAIRSGFVWDRASRPRQARLTFGTGYVSKMVGVDVAYMHDVLHKSNWGIQASIRVFLP